MPKGTLDEFLNALQLKIDELEAVDYVGSSESIDIDDTELESIYGEYNGYVDKLIDAIEDRTHGAYYVTWSVADGNIYLDVENGYFDDIDSYTVTIPLSDLTYNLDTDARNVLMAMAG